MAGGSQNPTFPLRVGAIDIGSNAIRFLAVEFTDSGTFTPLRSDRAAVRLGHGAFVSGQLMADAMDAATAALSRFKAQADGLGLHALRAVATSAVRESRNGDLFVRRANEEAGVEIRVIAGSEEARLVHVAVRQRVELGRAQWLLVDLGGGSVEVSLIDDHGILWTESHGMGSVRLLEELADPSEESGRFRKLLEQYVSTLRVPSAARYRAGRTMIATGGNIETIAKLVGAGSGGAGPSLVPVAELGPLIERLSTMSYQQRCRELGLRDDRADVILPAAMVYERIAALAGAHQVLVPGVGVREGIVLDLVDELTTHRDHEDRKTRELQDAAMHLGRRYMFDEAHAVHVAELASTLFSDLRELHRLGEDERRLLLAAALLHDVGQYVSYKGHHKHSLYLIANSELPGLLPRDMLIAANIARYHRKSEPAAHHEAYAALSEDDRQKVRLLAAILRVADALDRDHMQRIKRVRAIIKGSELILELASSGDLLLERWALRRKSEFFGRVYGRTVRAVSGGEPS
jgi:exopolyphosphatase/guanosine-5'-triphosphate,3'-diphosphate pyrophosphatase